MLINTHSHLKRFYQQHQTEIDMLSLLGKMLLTAIAVIVLLSVLGWATAINYASAWCDRLVESSLDCANPPHPPTVIQLTQQEEVVLTKTEQSELEDVTTVVAVAALEPAVTALPTDRPSSTFRHIKKQATKNQMALQSVLR
jgi:hypothetical protein